MKKYYTECNHSVYLDGYNQGAIANVDNYHTNGVIDAFCPYGAIESHLYSLGYTFNKEDLCVEEDHQGKAYYDILCNAENMKASKQEVKQWKKGKLQLYYNCITLFIYELAPIALS